MCEIELDVVIVVMLNFMYLDVFKDIVDYDIVVFMEKLFCLIVDDVWCLEKMVV